VVGLLALRLSRAEPPAAEAKPAVREKRKEKERDRRAGHASKPLTAVDARRPGAGFVLFAAGVVGFVFFLMELVWYRMLAPLLGGLLGRGRERVGRDVGLAYAWNTAGSILGSLGGGFGLLPLLSATGTWVLAIILLCGLALIALLTAGGRAIRLWLPVAAAAASLLLLKINGPTAAWRHSPIGAGRVELPRPS